MSHVIFHMHYQYYERVRVFTVVLAVPCRAGPVRKQCRASAAPTAEMTGVRNNVFFEFFSASYQQYHTRNDPIRGLAKNRGDRPRPVRYQSATQSTQNHFRLQFSKRFFLPAISR